LAALLSGRVCARLHAVAVALLADTFCNRFQLRFAYASRQNVAHSEGVAVRPPGQSGNLLSGLWHRKTMVIAAISIVAILLHLLFRFGFHTIASTYLLPLLITLIFGGLPMLYDLFRKLLS
jgi:hypothetical protein